MDCLTGIVMEVKESPDIALNFYNALLDADSSNAVSVAAEAAVTLFELQHCRQYGAGRPAYYGDSAR